MPVRRAPGRRAATVEFLDRLVDWAGGRGPFCDLTGVASSNLANYLNSNVKPPSWSWLERRARQVLGQPPAFIPLVEGHDLSSKPRLPTLPRTGGIYALFDSAMRVVYFGKATSLYSEIRQTLRRPVKEVRPWTGKKNLKFQDIAAYLSAYEIARGDAKFRHDVEAVGLRLFVNNTFNTKGANFKRSS